MSLSSQTTWVLSPSNHTESTKKESICRKQTPSTFSNTCNKQRAKWAFFGITSHDFVLEEKQTLNSVWLYVEFFFVFGIRCKFPFHVYACESRCWHDGGTHACREADRLGRRPTYSWLGSTTHVFVLAGRMSKTHSVTKTIPAHV